MCGVVISETFVVAYLEFPLSLARRWSNSLSSKTGREFVEKVGKRAKKKKRNESWEESKKKKEWPERAREMKEKLAHKPHDFEKLRSPTNAASDWCGAGSVDT